MISTIIYEDNTACIAQIRGRYIKRDRTNTSHQNSFTLMSSSKKRKLMSGKYALLIIWLIFKKLVHNISMHQLNEVN